MDNNATTLMPDDVVREMIKWCNRGNASASYRTARDCRAMMTEFRAWLANICGIDPCCTEPRDGVTPSTGRPRFKLIFTSGASESNAELFHMVINAYRENVGQPHVVISAIEHKSIFEMVQSLETRGIIAATYVQPQPMGTILPEDVGNAIQDNTCLVSIMHANNETGAINDVHTIGQLCHERNVPFHTDAVQSFGKFPLEPQDSIDAFSISFHKIYGPPGIGLLAIREAFYDGFRLQPIIYGSQNMHIRGGTENIPGIAASFAACKVALANRRRKNEEMTVLREQFIAGITKTKIPLISFTKYKMAPPTGVCLVYFSGSRGYLPNTILISLVKPSEPYVCNAEMKSALEAKKIIVSVGSACNTASAKASHVLDALGADKYIRKGTLRISFCDYTTSADVDKLIDAYIEVIRHQLRKGRPL